MASNPEKNKTQLEVDALLKLLNGLSPEKSGNGDSQADPKIKGAKKGKHKGKRRSRS